MSDTPGTVSTSTRRAALAFGARCATALAAIGLWPPASEAKRRKKKRKKKAPQVVARLVAPNMTGAKEFPGPGDPSGTGSASFTIMSNGQICAQFAHQSLASDSVVTQIHIHRGAAGASGLPVVDFSGFAAVLSGCVSSSQALLDEIRGNPAGFYANLHTNKFSGGAIRDQLQSA